MSDRQSTPLVLCCVAAVTFGLWFLTPASESAAYVNTRPAVSTQPISRVVSRPRSSPADQSFLTSEISAQPTVLLPTYKAQTARSSVFTTWLPLGVVVLSVYSIISNFLKKAHPELAPLAMASSSGQTREESKDAMRAMVDKLDSKDMQLLARGAVVQDVANSKGIDEVAKLIQADQKSRADLTPRDVILDLQRGNGRFWMGLSARPEMSAVERRALIMAQAPKVAVLSCSDSRVPVEIIFDQGLGEIFTVRMAGNVLDAQAHGSIEFAVKYLGVKAVLVIGHEACGAVKGALTMPMDAIEKEPSDLQFVLKGIKAGLDVPRLNDITDSRSREREAIVNNTSNQVKFLKANVEFKDRIENGTLIIAGAFYELSSGIVDFFSLDKNGLVIDL